MGHSPGEETTPRPWLPCCLREKNTAAPVQEMFLSNSLKHACTNVTTIIWEGQQFHKAISKTNVYNEQFNAIFMMNTLNRLNNKNKQKRLITNFNYILSYIFCLPNRMLLCFPYQDWSNHSVVLLTMFLALVKICEQEFRRLHEKQSCHLKVF